MDLKLGGGAVRLVISYRLHATGIVQYWANRCISTIAPHMLTAIYHSFPIALSLFMCGNLFPPSMLSTPPSITLSSFLAFIYVPFSSISFLKGKINALPFPAVRNG